LHEHSVYSRSTHYMDLWILSTEAPGEAITREDQNSTWLSIHSCCCFTYLYSQMPRLHNWPKGSQQLLPLRHTCILHIPMEKEKAWVSQATKLLLNKPGEIIVIPRRTVKRPKTNLSKQKLSRWTAKETYGEIPTRRHTSGSIQETVFLNVRKRPKCATTVAEQIWWNKIP